VFMKTNEDFYSVDLLCPQYIIPLYKLQAPADLYHIFSKHGIKGYNYGIYYNQDLLKIGFSYPSAQNRIHQNTFGERVVRQISHAPGWTNPFVSANGNISGKYIPNYGYVAESENGEEFYSILLHYQTTKLLTTLDPNDIYIHVWNLTNKTSRKFFFGNDDADNKRKGRYFEAILVEQHKLSHNGKLPIGNKDHDPTMLNNEFTKAQISKEAGDLFDWGS